MLRCCVTRSSNFEGPFDMDKGNFILNTKDLVLRKAVEADWRCMYENIWCHKESAKYMLWDITKSETDAKERIKRTIRFQTEHDYHWTVVEKTSGQAIGWAGLRECEPGVCEETGIAIGPKFTGKGYGKQILYALTTFAKEELTAKRFIACCRAENTASRQLQLACGFGFTNREHKVDPRDGQPYIMEYYCKSL